MPTNDRWCSRPAIRPEWLDGGAEIAIENLPTWYGRLSYRSRESGDDRVRLSVSGDLETPPGGIVVRSPLPRPLARVTVDGRDVTDFDATSVRLDRRAAERDAHY